MDDSKYDYLKEKVDLIYKMVVEKLLTKERVDFDRADVRNIPIDIDKHFELLEALPIEEVFLDKKNKGILIESAESLCELKKAKSGIVVKGRELVDSNLMDIYSVYHPYICFDGYIFQFQGPVNRAVRYVNIDSTDVIFDFRSLVKIPFLGLKGEEKIWVRDRFGVYRALSGDCLESACEYNLSIREIDIELDDRVEDLDQQTKIWNRKLKFPIEQAKFFMKLSDRERRIEQKLDYIIDFYLSDINENSTATFQLLQAIREYLEK